MGYGSLPQLFSCSPTSLLVLQGTGWRKLRRLQCSEKFNIFTRNKHVLTEIVADAKENNYLCPRSFLLANKIVKVVNVQLSTVERFEVVQQEKSIYVKSVLSTVEIVRGFTALVTFILPTSLLAMHPKGLAGTLISSVCNVT